MATKLQTNANMHRDLGRGPGYLEPVPVRVRVPYFMTTHFNGISLVASCTKLIFFLTPHASAC